MGRKEKKGTLSAAVPPAVVAPLPSLEADNVVDEPPVEASGDAVVSPPSLEAARLKALNAMLLKEIMERRLEVATLTARIEELSIAVLGTEEGGSTLLQSAVSDGEEAAGASRGKSTAAIAVELGEEPEMPLRTRKLSELLEATTAVEHEGKKKPEKKKKPAKEAAPARPARAHKTEAAAASAPAAQGGIPASASVAGQEPAAGRGTGRSSRRMKKPNSLYGSDTWAL